MRKLLSSDPKYRFSSAGEALRHPWIEYARSLQTPEEIQQERELLRSVLAAAEEAAEKAVEAADKAEEAVREQLEAEAAAAAAAALAAEAAALEAEAALRAAQEAAAAAAAAAKKAMADQKAQQAAEAAAAARAEKARAERAAEESAAAVVALAECQAAGADEELQLLLSPRAAATARKSGDGPSRSGRPGSVGLTQQRAEGPSVVRSERIHDSAAAEKQSTAAPAAPKDRAEAGLQRDDSFCRGAARFVAAARSPRTPRRRGGSVPRTAECGHGVSPAVGGVGGVSYGSTADSSAFVPLNQQQRAFAKGGAVAAAARPSVSGAARSLHLNAAQQAGREPLLGAPIRRGPSAVPGSNRGPQQAVGEQRNTSAAAAGIRPSANFLAQPPQRQRRRGGASDLQQLQPSGSAKTTSELHSKKAEETCGMQQVYRQEVREKRPEEEQREDGESENPAWYEGIVSFLEVVGAQSPRGNRLTS